MNNKRKKENAVIERRLARMRLNDKYYPILALDHGLTNGTGDIIPAHNMAEIVESCSQSIGGVVLTYGFAMSCRECIKSPLILQCFGAPLGFQRVQVGTIEQALRLDAAAVAVQIDFGQKDHLSSQIGAISSFLSEAHSMGIPVLFMVNGPDPTDLKKIAKSIRMCQELGADLIKIRCVMSQNQDTVDTSDLKLAIKGAPPLLLTGGGVNANIVSEVANAKKLGFNGYCIGRNIFKAQKPSEMAQALTDALIA